MDCDIWLTSDLHLFSGENGEFTERDRIIINNINSIVMPKDVLYIAGDIKYGNKVNIIKSRQLIKCKNVYITPGNHELELDEGFIYQNKKSESYFKSVSKLIEKRIRGIEVRICHYPLRRWKGDSNGSIMIHGHLHHDGSPYMREDGKLYKQFDVGIQKTGFPFNLREIVAAANTDSYCNFENHHIKV